MGRTEFPYRGNFKGVFSEYRGDWEWSADTFGWRIGFQFIGGGEDEEEDEEDHDDDGDGGGGEDDGDDDVDDDDDEDDDDDGDDGDDDDDGDGDGGDDDEDDDEGEGARMSGMPRNGPAGADCGARISMRNRGLAAAVCTTSL